MSRIEYRPIPGIESGYTALMLYPPGDFMRDDKEWLAMIGGCGVGRASDQEQGKAMLLAKAIRECDQQIQHAQQIIEHYQQQKAILERDGLVLV